MAYFSLNAITLSSRHTSAQISQIFCFLSLRCPNLRVLNLRCRITDQELVHLPKSLQQLHLWRCRTITQQGVSCFPNIISLSLSESTVDENILGALPQTLRELDLSGATVLNEHLKFLPRNLTSLRLIGCTSISDEGMIHLPRTLRVLDLSCWLAAQGPKITAKGAACLPPNLEYLNLRYSTIDDDALEVLPKTLKKIVLFGCFLITAKGLSTLPKTVSLELIESTDKLDLVF